jgi:1-acyl-sn-glycerol-3-phosphate acyltransferase
MMSAPANVPGSGPAGSLRAAGEPLSAHGLGDARISVKEQCRCLPGAGRSSALALLLRRWTGRSVGRFWVGSVSGLAHVPVQGPCIVISNHASYLDFLILSTVFELQFDRVLRFWASERITRHWFFRHYCGPAGCLEMSRPTMKESWRASLECLTRREDFLCIFPEGTRTRTGRLGDFKLGYVRLAAESQTPILPVRITNTFAVWPPQRWLPRLRRVDVEFFTPVRVDRDASLVGLRERNALIRSLCFGAS